MIDRKQGHINKNILTPLIKTDEKLGIMEQEYCIAVNDRIREDVSAMCNLSQGIRKNAADNALAGVIMNMYRKGYTSGQIAEIVEKRLRKWMLSSRKENSYRYNQIT